MFLCKLSNLTLNIINLLKTLELLLRQRIHDLEYNLPYSSFKMKPVYTNVLHWILVT